MNEQVLNPSDCPWNDAWTSLERVLVEQVETVGKSMAEAVTGEHSVISRALVERLPIGTVSRATSAL